MKTQRPHHCLDLQHLPLRGLQGEGDRLAEEGDDCERGDDGGGEGDGESRTLMAKSRSVNPRRVFRLGGPCAGVKHAGLVVRRAITPVTRP